MASAGGFEFFKSLVENNKDLDCETMAISVLEAETDDRNISVVRGLMPLVI